MNRLVNQLSKAVREQLASDATFSVVVDDPARETYGVRVRYYVDEDRGGFCGYVTRDVLNGLSQLDASAIVQALGRGG